MAKQETDPKRSTLSLAQTALEDLVSRCERLRLPPLGPAFAALSGSDLSDALICHRVIKNLGAAKVAPALRRSRSISAMLAYDSNGPTRFAIANVRDARERATLLQAKAWLAKHFTKIRRSHMFRAPSGETALSAHGDVDLLVKLGDPSQWRVSIEASKEAAAVCYHNHLLKRVVREAFRKKWPQDWKAYSNKWWVTCPPGQRPGWYVFHRMFVDCCVIQNVSRLSTVVKNGGTDRVISMEPFWNMVAQLSFAQDLRAILCQELGIDLNCRADLHRTLIRHARKATIDFRNASNSNWIAALEWLLPSSFYRKLMQLRTPVCEVDGMYHPYRMLAPMGCGFTFEVMTIVLLALSRACDAGASVFGDDVIIEADAAPHFVKVAGHLGWVVNEEKSFVSGNFRESCGGFYDLSTDTALLSYDFHEIEDLSDASVTANKLFRLLESNQCGPRVRKLLLNCYCRLIRLLPCETFREPQDVGLERLPEGIVLVPKGIKPHWREQGRVEKLVSGYWFTPVVVAYKWTYEPIVSRPKAENVDNIVYLACYIRRGNSYEAVKREHELCYKAVMSDSGSPLAKVPLFSFF